MTCSGLTRIWIGFQDLDSSWFFLDLDRFSQDLDIVCCSTIQRWQDIAAIETLFDRPGPFAVEWMKMSGFRIYFTKMGKGIFVPG